MSSMMKTVEAELAQMTADETANLRGWLVGIRAELDNAALVSGMDAGQAEMRLAQIAEIEALLVLIDPA